MPLYVIPCVYVMKQVTVETKFFSLKVVSTGYYWSPVSDHGTNQTDQSEQHTKGGLDGLCQHNVKRNGLSVFGEKCAHNRVQSRPRSI